MWQLREHHPEHLVRMLGCRDCLVEGEAEKVAGGPLFADAVSGRESCRQALLEPRSTQVRGEMSVIRGEQQWPARESRSRVAACGRGCQFFSPDLLAFRNIPKDRILQEVRVLVRNGQRGICLPTPKRRCSTGAQAGRL
jgi:hypothetical protein